MRHQSASSHGTWASELIRNLTGQNAQHLHPYLGNMESSLLLAIPNPFVGHTKMVSLTPDNFHPRYPVASTHHGTKPDSLQFARVLWRATLDKYGLHGHLQAATVSAIQGKP
jgi:hypothetical protein